MKPFAAPLLAAAMLASTPAAAQEMQLLPEGQTMVSLSVTERTTVPQDTLQASLRIEATDKDAKALQDNINKAMAAALKAAKASKDVKTSTGHYGVYQYTESSNGRSSKLWRGSQSIELESKDSEAILTLAGDIQEMGFAMSGLSYSLSNAKADEVRDGLMESALTRARAKAERAAKALGKSEVDIAQVNVDANTSYNAPMPVMRMQAMSAKADMADPSAEAGESEVTLTVTIHAVAK
jgi:predicted secreted protein